MKVDIDVDLEVKMMFVTAFKFRHVASEIWENGQLLSMKSETDDDGDSYKVKVERLGNGMFVEVNGQRRLAPGDILPSNLWNRAILTEDKILHPILGKVLPLEVTKLGKREIETEGMERSLSKDLRSSAGKSSNERFGIARTGVLSRLASTRLWTARELLISLTRLATISPSGIPS